MHTYVQNPLNKRCTFTLCIFFLLSISISEGSAQDPYQRVVRKIYANELGFSHFSGLASSPLDCSFFTVPSPQSIVNKTALINVSGDPVYLLDFEDSHSSPIYISFDRKNNSLLHYDTQHKELIEINIGEKGHPNPNALKRYPLEQLELNDVQGLTFDPLTGDLYVLDSHTPRIIRIKSNPNNRFHNLSARNDNRISYIPLTSLTGVKLSAIAFNQFDGRFETVDSGAGQSEETEAVHI